MTCAATYKNITIETDCDDKTVHRIVDELLKRRFFIQEVKKGADLDSHCPVFFHIGYKKNMVSVRIAQDIEKKWYCWIFSLKAFSKMQPPLFIIED